ncbi:hypothetical protein CL629_03900 [bacterium]|nr:hypothetical protein [bacterium]
MDLLALLGNLVPRLDRTQEGGRLPTRLAALLFPITVASAMTCGAERPSSLLLDSPIQKGGGPIFSGGVYERGRLTSASLFPSLDFIFNRAILF